jgi:DNA-binding Lrp family transcriptional regulator
MAWSDNHMRILRILFDDARTPPDTIARMTDLSAGAVSAAIAEMEAAGVIAGYPALINWEKTDADSVHAVIEVKVTPQRDMGFDAIASRIYRYDEVKSVYLMSGAYDLMLEVEAATLKQLAFFVSNKLSTLESVLSTATHFVLKKYKVEGRIMAGDSSDPRLAVSP